MKAAKETPRRRGGLMILAGVACLFTTGCPQAGQIASTLGGVTGAAQRAGGGAGGGVVAASNPIAGGPTAPSVRAGGGTTVLTRNPAVPWDDNAEMLPWTPETWAGPLPGGGLSGGDVAAASGIGVDEVDEFFPGVPPALSGTSPSTFNTPGQCATDPSGESFFDC